MLAELIILLAASTDRIFLASGTNNTGKSANGNARRFVSTRNHPSEAAHPSWGARPPINPVGIVNLESWRTEERVGLIPSMCRSRLWLTADLRDREGRPKSSPRKLGSPRQVTSWLGGTGGVWPADRLRLRGVWVVLRWCPLVPRANGRLADVSATHRPMSPAAAWPAAHPRIGRAASFETGSPVVDVGRYLGYT